MNANEQLKGLRWCFKSANDDEKRERIIKKMKEIRAEIYEESIQIVNKCVGEKMKSVWDKKGEYEAYWNGETFQFAIIYPDEEYGAEEEMYYYDENNQVQDHIGNVKISEEFQDKFENLESEGFQLFQILYDLEKDNMTEIDGITIKRLFDGYVDAPCRTEEEKDKLLRNRVMW